MYISVRVLRFRVSREPGNMSYKDYIGIIFPYSILTMSKYVFRGGGGGPVYS